MYTYDEDDRSIHPDLNIARILFFRRPTVPLVRRLWRSLWLYVACRIRRGMWKQ